MTRLSRILLIAGATGALAAAPALSAAAAPQGGAEAVTGTVGHGPFPLVKAPKNVIVMVGDGMGYNAIAQASLYKAGISTGQAYTNRFGTVSQHNGISAFGWQHWLSTDMSTYAVNGSYDPRLAWKDFEYFRKNPTDSSAAGTAMSTGHKTYNGAINVDVDKKPLKTVAQRAEELNKATGVVSTVPFTHATPAAWVAHNPSRNNYKAIGTEMIASDTDVIIGAGHPSYDDSHRKLAAPAYKYIDQKDFEKVSTGQTPFTYVEDRASFERIAGGKGVPNRLFGLAQVGSTFQEGRAGADKDVLPYSVARNDVPSLKTASLAALNVLNKDKDGFFLMIEGGAIDWAGHANQNTRSIEETLDFDQAIQAVDAWVQKNSSWNETVLIVTADHETGYLTGDGSDPTWTRMTNNGRGALPDSQWNSDDHTNQLVPVYFKGTASIAWLTAARKWDSVRGLYMDNTDIANVNFALWADRGPKGRH